MFLSVPHPAFSAFFALHLLSGVKAATAGCGESPTLTSGTRTVTVNGMQHRWILRIPDGYISSQPYHLIFGLHRRDGDMTSVESDPTMDSEPSQRNGAIFVAPNGLNKGWSITEARISLSST